MEQDFVQAAMAEDAASDEAWALESAFQSLSALVLVS
jgi:hypothetical protein